MKQVHATRENLKAHLNGKTFPTFEAFRRHAGRVFGANLVGVDGTRFAVVKKVYGALGAYGKAVGEYRRTADGRGLTVTIW